MQRRKLWATAGAMSVSAFAITVGLGANFGLFGITEPHSPVGRLDDRSPAATAGAPAQPVAAHPNNQVRIPAPDD